MRACLSVASWSTNPGCWWELYSSSTSSNVQDYQIGVTNYQPSSWQYFLVQGSQFFLQHPLIHWHAFSQQPGMWSLKGHNIIVSVWQSTRYVQFSGTTYIMIFRFFMGRIYQTTGRNWSLKPLSGIPGFTIVCGITLMSCGPVVHLHHGLCAVQSLKLWSSAHISVHWTDPMMAWCLTLCWHLEGPIPSDFSSPQHYFASSKTFSYTGWIHGHPCCALLAGVRTPSTAYLLH